MCVWVYVCVCKCLWQHLRATSSFSSSFWHSQSQCRWVSQFCLNNAKFWQQWWNYIVFVVVVVVVYNVSLLQLQLILGYECRRDCRCLGMLGSLYVWDSSLVKASLHSMLESFVKSLIGHPDMNFWRIFEAYFSTLRFGFSKSFERRILKESLKAILGHPDQDF